MEELKILVGMVAGLPQTAVWVLVGFLAYKLATLASIYGVIRLTVVKLHDYAVKRKQVGIELLLDGSLFDAGSTGKEELLMQLRRLQFIGEPGEHDSHKVYSRYGVAKLRLAIDKMYEESAAKKSASAK